MMQDDGVSHFPPVQMMRSVTLLALEACFGAFGRFGDRCECGTKLEDRKHRTPNCQVIRCI